MAIGANGVNAATDLFSEHGGAAIRGAEVLCRRPEMAAVDRGDRYRRTRSHDSHEPDRHRDRAGP
jgi:hypothetical protein